MAKQSANDVLIFYRLECTTNSHNKFYEIKVTKEGHSYFLQKRYGRIGTLGRTSVEVSDYLTAYNRAQSILKEKKKKGYIKVPYSLYIPKVELDTLSGTLSKPILLATIETLEKPTEQENNQFDTNRFRDLE